MKVKKIFYKSLGYSLNEMAQVDFNFKYIDDNPKKNIDIERTAEEYINKVEERKGVLNRSGVTRTFNELKKSHTDKLKELTAIEETIKNTIPPPKARSKKESENEDGTLTALQLEQWFHNNTNLTKNKKDKAFIYITTGSDFPYPLPEFLKLEIDKFFGTAFFTSANEPEEIDEGNVIVEANLENKFDLYLNKNENQIKLNDDPENKKITTDYREIKLDYGAKFELKKMSKKQLSGHYLFQSSRVSTYERAVDIVYDNLKLKFDNKDKTELKNIVETNSTHPDKNKVRSSFVDFLQENKDAINSKVLKVFDDGAPPLDFFDDLSEFMNRNKDNVITAPSDLYIFQINKNNPEDIKNNFSDLKKGIFKFSKEQIFFTPAGSRIPPFIHVEAVFSGKYPVSFFAEEKQENDLKNRILQISEFQTSSSSYKPPLSTSFVSGIRKAPENIFIGMKIKIPFVLEVNFKQG